MTRLWRALLCLFWGHDLMTITHGGVTFVRCVECGKWGRR